MKTHKIMKRINRFFVIILALITVTSALYVVPDTSYAATSYTVTYSANGGTSTPAKKTVTSGTTVSAENQCPVIALMYCPSADINDRL